MMVQAALGEAVWSALAVGSADGTIDGTVVCELDECTVVYALDDCLFRFFFLDVDFLIRNNPRFPQKLPGIPDGSNGTLYPLTVITSYASPRRQVQVYCTDVDPFRCLESQ